MSKAMVERLLERQAWLQEEHDLVVDADTHITDVGSLSGALLKAYRSTPNYYHGRPISREDLIREMDLAGVDCALSWQNPAGLTYGKDAEKNFEILRYANHYIAEAADTYPQRILPAGWTDPKALGLSRALKLVDICVGEWGFPIVKLNPAQNGFPIDSELSLAVVKHIVEWGAVPAFHFGGDTTFTPPEGLEVVAKRFPHSRIIGVHMGGGGSAYVEGERTCLGARKLGLNCPNLFYILSAKRDCHIESDLITYQLAGKAFCSNLACGSDAPYGRMTWNFGGFRLMLKSLMDSEHHTDERVQANPGLFNEGVVRGILGRNVLDVYGRAIEGILERLR